MASRSTAEKLLGLFQSAKGSYYQYQPSSAVDARGKTKGTYQRIYEGLTVERWAKHLAGEGASILATPLLDDNTCRFGAIDLDIYELRGKDEHEVDAPQRAYAAGYLKCHLLETKEPDADGNPETVIRLNVPAIIASIEQLKLPLYAFRSKSNGLHLYFFAAEPISGQQMRDTLMAMRAKLGFGKIEVFPKQSQRMRDGTGDNFSPGNGINLPFFGKTRQWIPDVGASEADADTFVELVTPVVLKDLGKGLSMGASVLGPEAPPCLQALCSRGAFPEGTRNNGLFDLAVFATKAFPKEWEDKVDEYAAKYCPTQSRSDISGLKKSIERKLDADGFDPNADDEPDEKKGKKDKKRFGFPGYDYKCDEEPIASHCQFAACRLRKFGTNAKGWPRFDGPIEIYQSQEGETFYKLRTNGIAIGFRHADLISPVRFAAVFSEQAGWIPYFPEGAFTFWMNKILAKDPVRQEVDFSATRYGQAWGHIKHFARKQAGFTVESLEAGRPYRDESKKRIYFTIDALQEYFEHVKFRGWSMTQLIEAIRALDGGGPVEVDDFSCFWIPALEPKAPTTDPKAELKEGAQ